MYTGIVNLRLGNFLADKSLNAKLNFGELTGDELVTLNQLHKVGEVGVNSQVQNLKLDIERLKAEMSIMHYIHKNEVQNMNLHEEMTTEVEKMVVAQELEKTLNEINPQSNT